MMFVKHIESVSLFNDFAWKKTLIIVYVNKAISSVQLVNFHTHFFRYSVDSRDVIKVFENEALPSWKSASSIWRLVRKNMRLPTK